MGCGDEKETVPAGRAIMDYTQPRFDRIDSRVFCDASTSQGMWRESLDLHLPPRGSPTRSLANGALTPAGVCALVSQLQTRNR